MKILYTIGHSNHPLNKFIAILHAHQITHLIDVRAIPKSRFNPWFNHQALRHSLILNNIHYQQFPELGGRRKPNINSINTAWKNLGFRGYADYMQTPEFNLALENLNKLLLDGNKVAVMCAEALPWRCHRSLIADAEIAREIKVTDIFNETTSKEHKITSFARIEKSANSIKIYYPNENLELKL